MQRLGWVFWYSCRRDLSVGLPPNIDLHHFIERDAVLAPVVELGGAGGGMRRHLARLLERAAVLQVSGDAGAAEGVVADLRCDAGRLGATAHHCPGITIELLLVEPPPEPALLLEDVAHIHAAGLEGLACAVLHRCLSRSRHR